MTHWGPGGVSTSSVTDHDDVRRNETFMSRQQPASPHVEHLLLALSLSVSLLAFLLLGLGVVPSAPDPSPSAPDDSTGAQIHTERIGDQLRVQGVFVSEDASADTLRYELSLRRSGATGTTQTTQSGSFAAGPGRADTLSTTQVNVQSGDTLTLHLHVRRDETPIDSARAWRTIR
ncbi:hypothetical protein SRM_p84016 (plasmid) [Salinibacter ruber M8]|uniref:Uncharacterized protein n=1 Tax=Salinibacter ruber (strain M8) TaxID=761659 RepID=D6CVZ3_SALRM|nr:hypothetical protein SRM_p84016 [Salinibacter ruber M8]